MNTFGNLGGVLAPIVFGVVVARYGSWTIPFYVSAGVYVMGALLWLVIDPDRPI
jgi:sugar phosphate permease